MTSSVKKWEHELAICAIFRDQVKNKKEKRKKILKKGVDGIGFRKKMGI